MALRYECRTCGAVRSDLATCRVCGSRQLRPVQVRLEPLGVGAGADPRRRPPFSGRRPAGGREP